MNNNRIIIVALMIALVSAFVLADPNGAQTVTEESTSTAASVTPGNHSAIAGNITEISIDGDSVTQAWAGYMGNVSGTITLENAAGNVLYNWSLSSPQGEVFAVNASSVSWSSIQCLNYSNNGTFYETMFGISATDADGINETFSTGNGHDAFSVGTASFTGGECPSTQIFDDTKAGVDNFFEEVLLYDDQNIIFTAILEEDELGFDNNPHDFEMIVLEDGHAGDSSTETYFFYIELE